MAKIKKYVDQAHKIFNDTSVFEFEVFDSDRQTAIDFLNKTYGNPGDEVIDRYLEVVSKLRRVIEGGLRQQ